jgi:hypothetical protein
MQMATHNFGFQVWIEQIMDGIAASLQFAVDLAAAPWLRQDFVNNRWSSYFLFFDCQCLFIIHPACCNQESHGGSSPVHSPIRDKKVVRGSTQRFSRSLRHSFINYRGRSCWRWHNVRGPQSQPVHLASFQLYPVVLPSYRGPRGSSALRGTVCVEHQCLSAAWCRRKHYICIRSQWDGTSSLARLQHHLHLTDRSAHR